MNSAAAKAGIKLHFPSEFGVDHANNRILRSFQQENVGADAGSQALKTVVVLSGLFADWVISVLPILNVFGTDRKKGIYLKVGNGNRKVSVTVPKRHWFGISFNCIQGSTDIA